MLVRPRVRLYVSAAVLVALLGFAAYGLLARGSKGAKAVRVADVFADPALVGERILVRGQVARIDKEASPRRPWWRVEIGDGAASRTLPVIVADGLVRSALSGSGWDLQTGMTVQPSGTLREGPVLVADDLFIRTGPARKQSSNRAMTVDVLLENRRRIAGVPVMVRGTVVTGTVSVTSGGDTGFTLVSASGNATVGVLLAGREKAVRDGAGLVVSGTVRESGTFAASRVRPAAEARP